MISKITIVALVSSLAMAVQIDSKRWGYDTRTFKGDCQLWANWPTDQCKYVDCPSSDDCDCGDNDDDCMREWCCALA